MGQKWSSKDPWVHFPTHSQVLRRCPFVVVTRTTWRLRRRCGHQEKGFVPQLLIHKTYPRCDHRRTFSLPHASLLQGRRHRSSHQHESSRHGESNAASTECLYQKTQMGWTTPWFSLPRSLHTRWNGSNPPLWTKRHHTRPGQLRPGNRVEEQQFLHTQLRNQHEQTTHKLISKQTQRRQGWFTGRICEQASYVQKQRKLLHY